MITFVSGNLLDAKVEALVNPVNTVGVMGKGLALQFKTAFPANYRAYEAAAKSGAIDIGKVFVFEAGGIVLPRYIVNFATKKHWRSPSTLQYVQLGLQDLVNVIIERKVRSIAIPPLGAGLGGLAWRDVRPLIEQGLAAVADDAEVLVFEPSGPLVPGAMSARPRS